MKIYRYHFRVVDGKGKVEREEFEAVEHGEWFRFVEDETTYIMKAQIGIVLLSGSLYLPEDNFEKAKEIFIQDAKHKIERQKKIITAARREIKGILSQIKALKNAKAERR